MESIEADIHRDLSLLYGQAAVEGIFKSILDVARNYRQSAQNGKIDDSKFSERDVVIIAYPDHLADATKVLKPLQQLQDWCARYVMDVVSMVHVLPFHPSTGYDGYSISDYEAVDNNFGSWADLDSFFRIGLKLMTDLVVNHCSPSHRWFQQFLQDAAPGRSYFITDFHASESWLNKVKRARNLPLIYDRCVTLSSGKTKTMPVWATYHRELVDLNWGNPEVLLEFFKLALELSRRFFFGIRLDAFAYVWKEKDTCCNNLPQTQVLLHLLRRCLDLAGASQTVFLPSITNTTQQCNFSNLLHGAHLVYHLPLSALLLHTLYSGKSRVISEWINKLDVPPSGRALLNLAASHDGVGLTWCREILQESDIALVVSETTSRGGIFVTRYETTESQHPIPWEICITYWSACSPSSHICATGDIPAVRALRQLHVKRFIATQSVVIALKGVPSLYFGLWMCSENDFARVESLKALSEADRNLCCIERAINRGRFTIQEWERKLHSRSHPQAATLREMKNLLKARRSFSAFHPDGSQRTIYNEELKSVFVLQRIPPSGNLAESIVCLVNFSETEVFITPVRALCICEDIATTKSNPGQCGICSNVLKRLLRESSCDNAGDRIDYAPVDLRFGLLLAPYEVMWLAAGWNDLSPSVQAYHHDRFPKILEKLCSAATRAGCHDDAQSLQMIHAAVDSARKRVPVGCSSVQEHPREIQCSALQQDLDFQYDAITANDEASTDQLLSMLRNKPSVSVLRVQLVHHGESTQKLLREFLRNRSGNRSLCYCFDSTIDQSDQKKFQLHWIRQEIEATTRSNPCPYFCEGIVDAPLTESGLKEKMNLREVLGGEHDAVVCSPECRALQTAIACFESSPITILNELSAMRSSHMHSCRSRLSILRQLFPGVTFQTGTSERDEEFDRIVPGQEDRLTMDARARRLLFRIFDLYGTQASIGTTRRVAIVSHFTFLFSLIMNGDDGRVFGVRPAGGPYANEPALGISHCPELLAVRSSPAKLTNCCLSLLLVRHPRGTPVLPIVACPSPPVPSSPLTECQKMCALLLHHSVAQHNELKWMFVAAAAANENGIALTNIPDAHVSPVPCISSLNSTTFGSLLAVVCDMAMTLMNCCAATLSRIVWSLLPPSGSRTTVAILAAMIAGVNYVCIPEFASDSCLRSVKALVSPCAVICDSVHTSSILRNAVTGVEFISFEELRKARKEFDAEQFYRTCSQHSSAEGFAFTKVHLDAADASPSIHQCSTDRIAAYLQTLRNNTVCRSSSLLHFFSRVLHSGALNSQGIHVWFESVGALLFGGCVVYCSRPRGYPSECSVAEQLIATIASYECSHLVVSPIDIPPLLRALCNRVELDARRRSHGLSEWLGPSVSPLPSLKAIIILPGSTKLSAISPHEELLKSLAELLPGASILQPEPTISLLCHSDEHQHDTDIPLLSLSDALEFLVDVLRVLPPRSTSVDLEAALNPENRLNFVSQVCCAFNSLVPFQTICLASIDKSRREIPTKESAMQSVLARIGGSCHVLNNFFRELLRGIGLDAQYAHATIHGAVDMHIAVILHSFLSDSDAWLVDVATGNRNILMPVCLTFPGVESDEITMGTWKVKFVRYDPQTKEETPLGRGIKRLHCDNTTASSCKFDHLFWTMDSIAPVSAYPAQSSPYIQYFMNYERIRAAIQCGHRDGTKSCRYFRADTVNDGSRLVAKAVTEMMETRKEYAEALSHEELFEQLCEAFPVISRSTIAASIGCSRAPPSDGTGSSKL